MAVCRAARLERLEWTGGFHFTSFGSRIGIRVNDASALERLPRHLPPASKPTEAGSVDRLYSLLTTPRHPRALSPRIDRLYVDGHRLARTVDRDEAFSVLESGLELSVSRNARGYLFVHAGVVGWRGRAVLIPGRSRSGKTSLVAALVRQGAVYLSDEFAVLDPEGRVHPYPRALSIREPGRERPRSCPVEELGGHAGAGPLPVGCVVFTRYREGSRWNPRPVAPGRSVLGLLDNTVLAQIEPRLSLSTLCRAIVGAAAIRSPRGDAREAARRLLDEACRLHTLMATRDGITP